MNLFEYLDRRSKRSHLRSLIKLSKQEKTVAAKIFDDMPSNSVNHYTINKFCKEIDDIDQRIEKYTNKLNELL